MGNWAKTNQYQIVFIIHNIVVFQANENYNHKRYMQQYYAKNVFFTEYLTSLLKFIRSLLLNKL